MSNVCKITYFWLFIAVGYVFHSLYHLSGGVFGEDIKMAGATGTMPYCLHFFRIVLEIGSLTMALLTTQLSSEVFRRISFVWAILLGLANGVHLFEELTQSPDNLSQIALLAWILVVNILLVFSLYHWQKDPQIVPKR